MTFDAIDYTTSRGKVRLLIGDTDRDYAIFDDNQIDAFVSMALDNNVKRAAAQALLVIAANEVYVQKRIRLLDLSTDGPAEAIQLRLLAKQLRQEADDEEITDDFDWAEMVTDPASYDERLWKQRLRS